MQAHTIIFLTFHSEQTQKSIQPLLIWHELANLLVDTWLIKNGSQLKIMLNLMLVMENLTLALKP